MNKRRTEGGVHKLARDSRAGRTVAETRRGTRILCREPIDAGKEKMGSEGKRYGGEGRVPKQIPVSSRRQQDPRTTNGQGSKQHGSQKTLEATVPSRK